MACAGPNLQFRESVKQNYLKLIHTNTCSWKACNMNSNMSKDVLIYQTQQKFPETIHCTSVYTELFFFSWHALKFCIRHLFCLSPRNTHNMTSNIDLVHVSNNPCFNWIYTVIVPTNATRTLKWVYIHKDHLHISADHLAMFRDVKYKGWKW